MQGLHGGNFCVTVEECEEASQVNVAVSLRRRFSGYSSLVAFLKLDLKE